MTLKQSRNLRVALALGFLVGGGFAALDSFAGVIQPRYPALAARIAANSGEALAGQADLALVAAIRTGPKRVIPGAAFAKAALRVEPLLPNALRDLGFERSLAGNRDGARAFMLAAVRQSRREQFALVWLIDDAARRNRISEALGWFDLSLRTNDDVRELLFPKLMAALGDPAIRKDFARYARRDPKWLVPFYSAAIAKPGGAEIVAETMLSTGSLAADRLDRGVEQLLLERLVVQGKVQLARRVYQAIRDNHPALLASPALTRDSIDPYQGGMAWQLSDGGSVSGRFVTVNGGPAITAVAYADYRSLIASKLLYLPPRRYRLRVALNPGVPLSALLAVEVGCAGTGRPLLKTDPAPKGGDWSFVVPSDCPAQSVRLIAVGGQGDGESEFTITSVSLSKSNSTAGNMAPGKEGGR